MRKPLVRKSLPLLGATHGAHSPTIRRCARYYFLMSARAAHIDVRACDARALALSMTHSPDASPSGTLVRALIAYLDGWQRVSRAVLAGLEHCAVFHIMWTNVAQASCAHTQDSINV